MIAVFSRNSLESHWVKEELSTAKFLQVDQDRGSDYGPWHYRYPVASADRRQASGCEPSRSVKP